MASVVPVAIDALLALAAARWPDVQRFDGPEPGWPEHELIAVGLAPDDLDIVVTREPRGIQTTTESADVMCLIRVATGETTSGPARVRAYELLDGLIAAVDADRSLGGAVGQAEVVSVVYVPKPGRRSRLVDLIVTVRVINF